MGETSHAGWKDFAGYDEGGGVGAEVEEELFMRQSAIEFHQRLFERLSAYLGNCEAGKFPASPKTSVITGDDTEHQRADKEALDLDPPPTKDLNEEDCEEVAWDVTCRSDYEIAVAILEQCVIFRFSFRKANVCEEHGLIEIDTIEGNVNQEPR